jgi:hypothetical protein
MLAKTTQLVIGTQWMDVVSSVLDALTTARAQLFIASSQPHGPWTERNF